jgi:hypothetical protein
MFCLHTFSILWSDELYLPHFIHTYKPINPFYAKFFRLTDLSTVLCYSEEFDNV